MTHISKLLDELKRETRFRRSIITEREFQKQVIELAHLFGWRVAHFRPARTIRNGRETWRTPVEADGAGFPDLVLAKDGRVLFVELKTDSGKLTKLQQEWHIALGENARIWRPADWSQIEAELANR